jgi:hypothetical protein
MARANQTLIAIRLDPDLLAAVDSKRQAGRRSRSQFIRDAIFQAVRDTGIPADAAYPQDRVGTAKGGRPRKAAAGDAAETLPVAAEDVAEYRVRTARVNTDATDETDGEPEGVFLPPPWGPFATRVETEGGL